MAVCTSRGLNTILITTESG
uniref:Uncharacterized protein n=1 Tax=Anguilla anguilla TaxID=7936 RepID=A0A0E9T6W5_ANGAN